MVCKVLNKSHDRVVIQPFPPYTHTHTHTHTQSHTTPTHTLNDHLLDNIPQLSFLHFLFIFYFFNLILFFNFTILYWFCHISE